MTITRQQLHTLRLLRKEAARRVYWSHRAHDYTWVHKDAQKPVTTMLHRLFTSGHATLSPSDRNMAVLTEKGRAAVNALSRNTFCRAVERKGGAQGKVLLIEVPSV
jgi:hypothetical protein